MSQIDPPLPTHGQNDAQTHFGARLAHLPMTAHGPIRPRRAANRTQRLDAALDMMQRSGHGVPDSYPWIFQQLRLAGLPPRPLHFMPWWMAAAALFPACVILALSALYVGRVFYIVYGLCHWTFGTMPADMLPVAAGAAVMWGILIGTEAKALHLPKWNDL